MGWRDWLKPPQPWWQAAISDLQCDTVHIRAELAEANLTLITILRELRTMATREDNADARIEALIPLLQEYLSGKDARIAELETALAEADAQKAAELAADSDSDAAKKEALADALEALMGRSEEPSEPETPVEPAPEPQPAPEPEAPADEQPSA